MAPRPHNSGHYTQNACDISQFEAQVRTLAGLPLPPPRQHRPAIMVNLLGDLWFAPNAVREKVSERGVSPPWAQVLALPGTHLHLYGKLSARPGRKMGHLNITAPTVAEVRETAAKQAAQRLAAGSLVGMPTETVYGLAADADNATAVHRIFEAKGRPADHPLIVHVVRQYSPSRGGLEDVVANLSSNLLDNGYRVRVVTLDRLFREPEKTLPAHAMAGNVEVVRIPWRGSSRYPIAPQVFRHIRDADLVHVHGVDFFFDALAWTRMLHRKPLVATTHGGFFHTKKFANLKKIWFSTVTRLSAFAYRSVICCSQSDLEMFRKIAAERAALIENGVDLVKF
eukprot:gene45406-60663_t